MNPAPYIAKHLRELHFGDNWTWSNMKDNLAGITWQEAITKVYDLNTIAVLVFHMNYYICSITRVLEGKPLDSKDELSFSHPPVQSQHDWDNMVSKIQDDAENLAKLIAALPEAQLWENFTDEKYGNYYRHLHGLIEHSHYHLGQVAIIKKILRHNG